MAGPAECYQHSSDGGRTVNHTRNAHPFRLTKPTLTAATAARAVKVYSPLHDMSTVNSAGRRSRGFRAAAGAANG